MARGGVRSRSAVSTTGQAALATYLYCVVRSPREPAVVRAPDGLPGGERPAVLAAGRALWLVVSQVPLDRYGPERLETSLRDLEWVAEVAVAHEAVVEHFARLHESAVVPMKLFTMFSSDERALAEMQQRRRIIEGVLKRIAGCEEWGVRVTGAARQAAREAAPEVTSGTAFLAARKKLRDNARAAVVKAASTAAAVFDELAPLSKDARRRSDTPPGAVPPLLDAAFLVPFGKRAKFRTAARRASKMCTAAGVTLTLTGPWPAYNFVQPPGEPR